MNGRNAARCLLALLWAFVSWAVLAAVLWLGQSFHMTLMGALVALLLLAWLWWVPAARRIQPDVGEEGAVLAGATGAKPLGLLGALAGLYAALAGFCLSLGPGYGLIGLILGGLGSSLIVWSWWRPFRLRIGRRPRLPWWTHLATSAGVATVATIALVGYTAAATAHEADRRARALHAYLARSNDSMRNHDYDATSEWLQRAMALDPEAAAVRHAQAALARGRENERDYRRAKRLRSERRYASALRVLTGLGSYRDAETLRRRYQEEGVKAFMRRARRSVADKPSRALADLRRASHLDRSVARTRLYKDLRAEAKQVAAARRAMNRGQAERHLGAPPAEGFYGYENYGGSGGGSYGEGSAGTDRLPPYVPFE